MNKYLKFEYWNTCDLGNIYYQGGHHFWFFLDGDVLEPFHEDTEDGQENGDGDFVPTYRRQMKRYWIKSSLIPEHLIDAIQRMKLHDNIELTFKTGEVEQVYNLDIEVEWQFEKYCWQGTVTITFDMDEKVVLGACCDNLTVGEVVPPEPIPDLYWVAETGSDISGDGSYANPWATLGYATTQAITPGDVIHVKAGTITETLRSDLAVGVSIVGQGDTSIVKASAALDPMFSFSSAVEGTNGNQSISYIMMDGDLTAEQAILAIGRSNIELHHVTIKNFLGETDNAIIFGGHVSGAPAPYVYATGIEIHDCTFTNNACDFLYDANTYFAWSAVEIRWVSGALVYNNIFDNVTGGRHGYGIKCINGSIRGSKIYDNDFSLNFRDEAGKSSYAFAIELWNGTGGVEVYNNTCNGGGIDLAGRGWEDNYGYGFTARVHHNTVEMDTQPVNTAEAALLFESGCTGGVYFYNNYVKSFTTGFALSLRSDTDTNVLNIDGLYLHYNIFENLGRNNSTAPGWGITFNIVNDSGSPYSPTINNFNVFNNVIYHSVLTAYGLYMAATTGGAGATWTDIQIVNNIFANMYWPCQWKDQTLDNVIVKNNIFYNPDDATMFVTCTVTNDDVVAGTDVNPLFVGGSPFDFHLQAGSPAINAGIVVGVITHYYDMDDVLVSPVVEIGAYQYIP
jgi:hypothetical protein